MNTNKKISGNQTADQLILTAALKEFSSRGFSGARIDEIAEKTNFSKRMIYYYFKDKQDLFVRCLEKEYQKLREAESKIDISIDNPIKDLQKIIETSIDHHFGKQDYVRLVVIENIHYCKHFDLSERIQAESMNSVGVTSDVYNRGVKNGLFRSGMNPLDIHWMIASMSFFSISNKYSFNWVHNLPPYDESSTQITQKIYTRCCSQPSPRETSTCKIS